ncbi:hypothetical protein HMI54_014549 [Coelomomyces lativittatus]|nr:hypothetical protein HMI56_001938 [Coelomomyces lativittatus]KAJ1509267.1 hypothetical protein HMI55_000039 [Coelomomyces lativittatus]KAJ1518594.1 hypothetical protein HMI54_014549 [Coelomomyces lativittatus]
MSSKKNVPTSPLKKYSHTDSSCLSVQIKIYSWLVMNSIYSFFCILLGLAVLDEAIEIHEKLFLGTVFFLSLMLLMTSFMGMLGVFYQASTLLLPVVGAQVPGFIGQWIVLGYVWIFRASNLVIPLILTLICVVYDVLAIYFILFIYKMFKVLRPMESINNSMHFFL